jgi:hypothetical protein
MNLKNLAAYTGLGLVVWGVAMTAIPIVFPKYFVQLYKDLAGAGGWQVHTNIAGLGILVVGAALLAFASAGSRSGP